MTTNFGSQLAHAFSMTEEVWQRHANPWSVWTRFTVLPILILAIWSRVWLGWWAIAPVSLTLIWTWINPRLFTKPTSTQNWTSKAVLGERVWINRNTIPIPNHHQMMANLLSVISACGLPFLIWGLITLSPWPTALGAVVVYAGKVWFLDRMVWLYEDMAPQSADYQAWLY